MKVVAAKAVIASSARPNAKQKQAQVDEIWCSTRMTFLELHSMAVLFLTLAPLVLNAQTAQRAIPIIQFAMQ